MSLAALLLLPLAGSLITALLPTRARTALAGWAGVVSIAAAVWVILLFPEVKDGGVIRQEIAWLPSAGLNFVLRVDGFAIDAAGNNGFGGVGPSGGFGELCPLRVVCVPVSHACARARQA